MDDTKLMDVLYSRDDLLEEPTGFLFLKSAEWTLPLVLYDVVEQLTTRSILCDKVEMSGVFDNFV